MLFTQLLVPLALASSAFAAPTPEPFSGGAALAGANNGGSILGMVADAVKVTDLGDWVRGKLKGLRDEHKGSNIFIYHANHDKFKWSIKGQLLKDVEEHVQQVTFLKHFGPTEQYRVLVFNGEGEIENKGDGGYQNWATFGNCEKDGDKKIKCK